MTISMIGIDHGRAPVDIRALFAFTKKNAGEAMEKLKHTAGVHGCVILSTCNRLEIWASHEEDQELSLYQCLCRLKGVQEVSYEKYFVTRKDKEAAAFLHEAHHRQPQARNSRRPDILHKPFPLFRISRLPCHSTPPGRNNLPLPFPELPEFPGLPQEASLPL